MTPTFIEPDKLKQGDLFTVFPRTDEEAPTEGKLARGRIFRFRELAYPFVFASFLPTNTHRWGDSPWRLDMTEGIKLIKLTNKALFLRAKKPVKKK